jgi:hypothetical protein
VTNPNHPPSKLNFYYKVAVFYVVAPCSLVKFAEVSVVPAASTAGRRPDNASPKRLQTSTGLHTAAIQKMALFILAALRTRYLTKL